MKKIFVLFLMISILCSGSIYHNVSALTMYTDFSGYEFNESSDIVSGTYIKTELENTNSEEISGIMIYGIYGENNILLGCEYGEEISILSEEASKSVTYKIKKTYKNVKELKIFLWNNSCLLVPAAKNLAVEKATGADGPSDQYRVFGEVPEDKLSEQMPIPFNINNYRTIKIAEYDFNDFNFENYNEKGSNECGPFTQSYSYGNWSIVNRGGTDNSPCVKIGNYNGGETRFQLVYKSEDALPGDWYYICFKVKGENITGTPSVRAYIEFQTSYGKNAGCLYGDKAPVNEMKTNWTKCAITEMVKTKANDIDTPSEYYNIYINAFSNYLEEGESVYIDDIELHKVIFEPMETVLMYPNYKGLIYGGGVGDIGLRAFINDCNGAYNLKDLSIKCSIKDEKGNIYAATGDMEPSRVCDVNFSSNILPQNKNYYVETVLSSKLDSSVIQKQEWTLRKRDANYRPTTYIDEFGRYIRNGKAELPMIQAAHGGIYEEYADIVSGTSVDAFTVAGTYHTEYRTPRMQKFRNTMKKRKIGHLLETCGYVYSHLYTGIPKQYVKKQTDIRSLLTVMLNNFKNDESLWGYRVFDEENSVLYGEELRWQNDIMSEVDINHPTLGITDKLFPGKPGVFSKTCDIIGVDPYYCTGKDDQCLSNVGKMIVDIKALNPNRPVFVTLQGFWYKDRGDLRGPTQEEYRNMAWQSVCEGVSIIDNFAYTDVKTNPWDGKTASELWREQMEVYDEISEFEDVILSTLPAPYFLASGSSENFKIMTRRYNDKSYVFAVNLKNTAATLKIKLKNAKNAKEFYTNKTVAANDAGYFNINMKPYGVAILEAEQDDYKSSHYELKHFSVTRGSHSYLITNADTEMPVIVIDDGAEKIEYNIRASEKSSIYINGKAVNKTGEISIRGINKLTVKIVSEDGKFFREKTFYITNC